MKIKLQHENVFFTSDTHFGHFNIMKYDNRPFKSIEEHDKTIIENWNNKVAPNDTVFHLGDFSFQNGEKYADSLNGNIYFVKGNHDRKKISGVNFVDYVELSVLEQRLYLFHYPIAEWNCGHHGAFHLYGHTHGNSWFDREFQPKYKCLNVGTNLHNYTPVSYKEVCEIMEPKSKIVHH